MFNFTKNSFFLILISSLCGGSVYPLIKIAEKHDIPKFGYIFWEALFVVLILSIISLLNKETTLMKKEEGKYYLFCALTNILIPQALFFVIAPNMPASVMSLIIILTPIFVYLVLLTFFQEPLQRIKMAGVLLGLAGTALLFLPSIFEESYYFHWGWAVFALLLPLDYTINRVFVTHLQPKDSPPYRLAIGLFASVAVIAGAIMLITGNIYIPFQTFHAGDLALLAHSLIMVVFYICFFIIARLGAVQNSLTFYIAPLVGATWGILFFAEQIDAVYIIAAGIIFYALHLTTKKIQ